MNQCPLRTSVIGSYPFPAWLEHASQHLERFGSEDRAELQSDAVTCAVKDQLAAGLDVITDGEQTRLDFNLSFDTANLVPDFRANVHRRFSSAMPEETI